MWYLIRRRMIIIGTWCCNMNIFHNKSIWWSITEHCILLQIVNHRFYCVSLMNILREFIPLNVAQWFILSCGKCRCWGKCQSILRADRDTGLLMWLLKLCITLAHGLLLLIGCLIGGNPPKATPCLPPNILYNHPANSCSAFYSRPQKSCWDWEPVGLGLVAADALMAVPLLSQQHTVLIVQMVHMGFS